MSSDQEKYIMLRDVETRRGIAKDTLLSWAKRFMPELISKQKFYKAIVPGQKRLGTRTILAWAILSENEDRIVSAYESGDVSGSTSVPGDDVRAEIRAAKQYEAEGYQVLHLWRAGTPDLMLLRVVDGRVVVSFREVKGESDSLRREQAEFIGKLNASGLDAAVAWEVNDKFVVI